jgi:hypothetical protein
LKFRSIYPNQVPVRFKFALKCLHESYFFFFKLFNQFKTAQTISLVGKIIVIWSSNGQSFILPQQKEDIIDMASKYVPLTTTPNTRPLA